MPNASVMADAPKPTDDDTSGAPVPKDAIDPELVKLTRARPKVGIITAAALVFLSGFFLIRLGPDRRFAGSGEPTHATVADVLGGKIADDTYITLDGAEPMMAQAIRTTPAKGSLGFRVVPVRGAGEQLWLVLSGDGWDEPQLAGYVGRLRRLGDLPLAPSIASYAAQHPRAVFATPAAVRAGFRTGKIATVTGDTVAVADGDRVALDIVDPDAAIIACTLNDRLPTAAAWATALAAAGLELHGEPQVTAEIARFEVVGPNIGATVQDALDRAKLFAARIEPRTRHQEGTWRELAASGPSGLAAGGQTIADAKIDLVGLYVARAVPSSAYVVIGDERPADYWYVLPVTIALALIGLVFAWALVRAVRRDVLPTRA
ncbi:MAG TPA: hypothetical protein VLX92_20240 [Kofleriaceae bacterium]|nr:hypothetical protein [Kofleriaceae bacterium]